MRKGIEIGRGARNNVERKRRVTAFDQKAEGRKPKIRREGDALALKIADAENERPQKKRQNRCQDLFRKKSTRAEAEGGHQKSDIDRASKRHWGTMWGSRHRRYKYCLYEKKRQTATTRCHEEGIITGDEVARRGGSGYLLS